MIEGKDTTTGEVFPDLYADNMTITTSNAGVTLTFRLSQPPVEPVDVAPPIFTTVARLRLSHAFASGMASLIARSLDQAVQVVSGEVEGQAPQSPETRERPAE